MAQPVVGRAELVASNITAQMKEALHREARRRGVSQSMLVFNWILDNLRKAGHHIKDVPTEFNRPGRQS